MTTFTDDFNRADSTDLGAGWVEVSGDWSIISNQLAPPMFAGTVVLRAAGAMDSNDHYAQVTLSTVAAASQGVWCRGNTSITNGYLWRNDGVSWDLFSVVSNTFTAIGTFAGAANAGDVAKIQAVGSTIKGFVNGVERVSVVNTAVTSGASVGIRTATPSGIRYDDFTAADVVAGATLGTVTETDAAQPLTGFKSATLQTATAAEAAQTLTATKAATVTSTAEQDTGQSLAGVKAGALGVASTVEQAQPLAGVLNQSLSPATSVEAAQPLTGAKSATLQTAMETSTARPLVTAGPDEDIDVTVGAPYSAPYTVGAPQPGRWEVGAPW